MEFSTSTVAKIVGATVRQVDHWARKGVLKPSGRDAAGKGSRRRWRLADVVALQAIRELRAGGCPLPMIHKVVKHLMTHYPSKTAAAALARVKLFAFGKRVFIVKDDDRAMDVLSRQTMFCLPIGNLILETNKRVQSLPHRWSETVLVGGQGFRFDVGRARAADDYVARCRELPGAVARGETADEAVTELKRSVAEVLALESGAHRPSRRRASSRVTVTVYGGS